MWRGGGGSGSSDSDSREQPRQGCSTFSSSSYSCTNGHCKETKEEYRKCPGMPLQRLQRSSDGTSTWVTHSGDDMPWAGGGGGGGGGAGLHDLMRIVMCAGSVQFFLAVSDTWPVAQARARVVCASG
jgi:hypothetical protein